MYRSKFGLEPKLSTRDDRDRKYSAWADSDFSVTLRGHLHGSHGEATEWKAFPQGAGLPWSLIRVSNANWGRPTNIYASYRITLICRKGIMQIGKRHLETLINGCAELKIPFRSLMSNRWHVGFHWWLLLSRFCPHNSRERALEITLMMDWSWTSAHQNGSFFLPPYYIIHSWPGWWKMDLNIGMLEGQEMALLSAGRLSRMSQSLEIFYSSPARFSLLILLYTRTPLPTPSLLKKKIKDFYFKERR